jgi:hypothetical protein
MPACLCLFRTCVRSSPGRCRRRRKRESPTSDRRCGAPHHRPLFGHFRTLSAPVPPHAARRGAQGHGNRKRWLFRLLSEMCCCSFVCVYRSSNYYRVLDVVVLACPVVLVCCLLLAPCSFARGCLSVVKFTQPHPHRSFGKRPPSPKGYLLAYLGCASRPQPSALRGGT